MYNEVLLHNKLFRKVATLSTHFRHIIIDDSLRTVYLINIVAFFDNRNMKIIMTYVWTGSELLLS